MKFSKHSYTTFTITIANPAVITSTDHELYEDDIIQFITTGALPTGISVDTKYYVILDGITSSTFRISTEMGGEGLITTGSQSGAHSYIKTNRASLRPYNENNR